MRQSSRTERNVRNKAQVPFLFAAASFCREAGGEH